MPFSHFSATPSTASSPSPLRDERDEEVGDICSAAMDLITFLDTKALKTLERSMSDRCFTRSEVVGMIADALNNCPIVTAPNSCGDNGEVLRKSDADFRATLRNCTTFSLAQLEALADSIDKHGTNRIRFSDIMSFLVAAGRKTSPVVQRKAAGDAPAQQTFTQLSYAAEEVLCPANYFTIVAVKERNCFLAATLRWVDIVDEHLQVLPVTRRIAPPPGDPSSTVACVGFSAAVDEVVLGLNNMKLMTFNFLDGRKQREVVLTGVPATLYSPPLSLGSAGNHGTLQDCSGVVLCGTEDGLVLTVSLTEQSSMRVSSSAKIAATRINSMLPFSELGLVVCVSGKCLLICDGATGELVRPPYIARGIITASMVHAPSSSLVFACTTSSTAIYYFSRRMLKGLRLEVPACLSRNRGNAANVVADSIILVAQDPYTSDQVVSVTASGCISFWNLTQKSSASAVELDGPEIQLRLPPTATRAVTTFSASLTGRQCLLFGGKNFICRVRRQQLQVAVVEEQETRSVKKLRSHFELPVATLPLAHRHSAFPHPTRCFVSVFPQGVQVVDATTSTTLAELSFGASPVAAAKQGKQALRIRSACFGPGLMILLGSENGDLHTFSLEASSIGDCDMIAAKACPSEISHIFFCAAQNVVGYADFDGTLQTAALSEDCSSIKSVITAAAVHRCDALHYAEEQNILGVVDLEEKYLRVFNVVSTGTRLRQLARVSLLSVGSPMNSSWGPTLSSIPMVSQGKSLSTRIVVLPNHSQVLSKQLFSDETELAKILLTSSTQGATDSCNYSLFSLTTVDEDAKEESFLTRVKKLGADASNVIKLRSTGSFQQKTVTAISPGLDSEIILGFSDGSVSQLDTSTGAVHGISLDAGKSVVFQQEPVSQLCLLPALHNISVSRLGEKPKMLYSLRANVVPSLSAATSNLRAQDADTVSSPGSTTRKARSAKPERPSPLLPKLAARSGSAGCTPAPRAQNSILEVLSQRGSSSKKTSQKWLMSSHLPPIDKRR